jgi:hypothetical protein
MPKKTEAPDTTPEDEVLVPFGVVIDGQDRTVFAKDLADLEVRVAKLRAQ